VDELVTRGAPRWGVLLEFRSWTRSGKVDHFPLNWGGTPAAKKEFGGGGKKSGVGGVVSGQGGQPGKG